MSTQTVGRALLVQQHMPRSVAITTTTGAAVSPIVVTTATAHGVKVNELVRVSGVVGNTAANRDWYAAAVTSSTITLRRYPEDTNGTGNGAYVSGGFVQPLGFGITVPIPNDLTDIETAGSVNVPHEAELDRLAWLLYQAWVAQDKYALTPSISVAQAQSFNTWNFTDIADGAYHDSTILVTMSSAKVGDVLTISFSCQVTCSDSTWVDLGIYEDTSGVNALTSYSVLASTGSRTAYQVTVTRSHTLTNAGALKVVIRTKANSGETLTINGDPGSLHVQRVSLGI